MKQLLKGICVSAALLFSLTATAKSKQYEVIVNHPLQAGSLQLKPGKYQLEAESGTATLYQGKKEVGKLSVRSEETGRKVEITTLDLSGDTITAIELGGTKTKLVISGR